MRFFIAIFLSDADICVNIPQIGLTSSCDDNFLMNLTSFLYTFPSYILYNDCTNSLSGG